MVSGPSPKPVRKTSSHQSVTFAEREKMIQLASGQIAKDVQKLQKLHREISKLQSKESELKRRINHCVSYRNQIAQRQVDY